jgi:formylglycine-generating enzyme required for sulfatase activity
MTRASLAVTQVVPEMVVIPSGDYVMGCDGQRPDEAPRHRVRVRSFRAALAPVSNREYARFVEATSAASPPFADDARFVPSGQPVVGISWHDAIAYCAWLMDVSGIPFRLPTEAEREWAALGDRADVDWPWELRRGDGARHSLHDRIAVLDQPHVPSEACANGYGLMCVAENVHEWCSDWYDGAYYARSPVYGPPGPQEGRRRSSRGGSWRHAIKFTRVTARASLDPGFRYNDFGFRVYADI